jgi:hypothetical protein
MIEQNVARCDDGAGPLALHLDRLCSRPVLLVASPRGRDRLFGAGPAWAGATGLGAPLARHSPGGLRRCR